MIHEFRDISSSRRSRRKKWKESGQEEGVYWFTYPIFTVSLITCVTPIPLRKNRQNSTGQRDERLLPLIEKLQACVIYLLEVACLGGLLSKFINSSNKNNAFDDIVFFIIPFADTCLLNLIFPIMYFKRNRIRLLLEKLRVVDREMRKYDLLGPRSRKTIWRLSMATLFTCGTAIVYYAFGLQQLEYDLYFPAMFSYITFITLSLQFSALLRFIRFNYEDLNRQLSKLNEEEQKHDEHEVIKLLNHCAACHLSLSKEAKELNGIYGQSELIHAIQILEGCVYQSVIALGMLSGLLPDFTIWNMLSDLIVWDAFHMISFAYSVVQCEKLLKEMKATGPILIDMQLKTTSTEIGQELRLLSIQLEHTKTRFTGSKFITLDQRIFVKIGATILTNIIILAQFQSNLVNSN